MNKAAELIEHVIEQGEAPEDFFELSRHPLVVAAEWEPRGPYGKVTMSDEFNPADYFTATDMRKLDREFRRLSPSIRRLGAIHTGYLHGKDYSYFKVEY